MGCLGTDSVLLDCNNSFVDDDDDERRRSDALRVIKTPVLPRPPPPPSNVKAHVDDQQHSRRYSPDRILAINIVILSIDNRVMDNRMRTRTHH